MFGDFHNAGGGVAVVNENQNAIGIFCAGGMQNVFARAIAVIHFKAVFIGLADDVGIVVDNRNLRAIGNRRLAGDLADAAEADHQRALAVLRKRRLPDHGAVQRRRTGGCVMAGAVQPVQAIGFARGVSTAAVELIAGAADGEALLVEQLANTPNQEHFMMLIVAPVTASFYRF